MAERAERFITRVFEGYANLMAFFFFVFLFCLLSFGRAFSTLHWPTPFLPVFVTELFLALNMPVLLYKFKYLARLPRLFLAAILPFFMTGCLYLFYGLFRHNLFALRDITISGYLLFIPLAFIYLNSLKRAKVLLFIVILSNIFNLYSRQCLFFDVFPSISMCELMFSLKTLNMGLYLGIENAFIIAFYGRIRTRFWRIAAAILLALNLSAIMIFAATSIWLATITSFLFLLVIIGRKTLKVFFVSGILLVIVMTIIFFSGARLGRPLPWLKIVGEVRGISSFSPQEFPKYEAVEATSGAKPGAAASAPKKSYHTDVALSNINWRVSIWKQTWEFASDAILFGKGFGAYPVYRVGPSRQYPTKLYMDSGIIPPHNQFLTVFLKMGVFGSLLFFLANLYVFLAGLAYLKKANLLFIKRLLVALLGGFVFWHSLAFLFDLIDSPPTSVILWLIMGFILGAIETDRRSQGAVEDTEKTIGEENEEGFAYRY